MCVGFVVEKLIYFSIQDPPWMENVYATPDLVYRYQMKDQELGHVLQADLQALKNIHQPFLVNDQLGQFYLDMELEGLSTKLKLEEGITSSSGSSAEDVQSIVPENVCSKVGIKGDSSNFAVCVHQSC
jgi:period circadian protein